MVKSPAEDLIRTRFEVAVVILLFIIITLLIMYYHNNIMLLREPTIPTIRYGPGRATGYFETVEFE